MARQARIALAGQTYLLAQLGHNRQPIFTNAPDYNEFIELMRLHASQEKIALHGFCLEPTQWLALLTPASDTAMPRWVQQIGRSYSRRFNLRHARSGSLFAGRYCAALLQADKHLLDAWIWMETAALRAGQCASADQWAWSSCQHHLGLAQLPFLQPHPGFYALGNTPFAREQALRMALSESMSQKRMSEIEVAVRRNHVLGSEAFIQEMEQLTGKRLRVGQRGRPRKTSAQALVEPRAV